MKSLPKSRNSNIVVQEMNDETLVYDLNINKAFCLNETSKLVWHLCNGKRTFAEIADEMSKQTKQLVSEDVVYLAIEQLNTDGLLENDTSDEFNRHFNGMSRREVIKKVGFASLIALPIITGIVAPTAAHAQSGGNRANNTTCTTSSQCASNNCINTNNAGMQCCAGGATNTQSSGSPTPVMSSDKATCDFFARVQCCSGSATFTAPRSCICN